jgi:ABC-type transport system involved in Fe-S cluster assembly fused permease/ATPase subunit
MTCSLDVFIQETVKLFANAPYEIGKFDEFLGQLECNSNRTTESIAMLNIGQVCRTITQ